MLIKLSNATAHLYSGRLMIALFLGVAFFFWLFNFSSFPVSDPELRRLSNGEGLLDVRFYYTAQEAFRAMDRYGVPGRALYLRFLALDSIFAPLYGLAFSLLFTRLTRKIHYSTSRWNKTNLLPIAIATTDITENVCLFLLLEAFPKKYHVVGSLAGIATLTKWCLTIVTLGVLIFQCLYLVMRRLRTGSGMHHDDFRYSRPSEGAVRASTTQSQIPSLPRSSRADMMSGSRTCMRNGLPPCFRL